MKKLSIYVLLIALVATVFSGCKKSSSSSNSSNADFYFVGKIDASDAKFEVTSTSDFSTSTSAHGLSATPPDTTLYSYEGGVYNSVDPDDIPSVGLNFQTISWVDYSQADSIFLNSFTTGSKSFILTEDLGPNGVSIIYRGTALSYFTSIGGTGITQPASSYVNVISVDKFPATFGVDPYVVVKADIKAVLYEYDFLGVLTGNTVNIEGTIKVPITKTL